MAYTQSNPENQVANMLNKVHTKNIQLPKQQYLFIQYTDKNMRCYKKIKRVPSRNVVGFQDRLINSLQNTMPDFAILYILTDSRTT